jgi:hypothetical protein
MGKPSNGKAFKKVARATFRQLLFAIQQLSPAIRR